MASSPLKNLTCYGNHSRNISCSDAMAVYFTGVSEGKKEKEEGDSFTSVDRIIHNALLTLNMSMILSLFLFLFACIGY